MNEITGKITAYQQREKDHRLLTEQYVIGAVLLEGDAITQVIDLLSWKNFTQTNQIIWKAITSLWPDKPIDLRTVYHALREKITDQQSADIALMLTNCISNVNSTANLKRHALQLIEMSVLDQFLQLYISHCNDEKVAAFGTDIIEALITNGDKLQLIEDAVIWMNRVLPDHDFTLELKKLNHAINGKVEQIKRANASRILLERVEALGKAHHGESRELISVFLALINTNKIPPRCSELIYQLRPALHAKPIVNQNQPDEVPF